MPIVRTGDPVHLDLYWSGRVPLGRRYELGITFTHSSGVLTAASRSMVSTRAGMRSGRARLTLDAFPLVAGSYHIGAGVAEVGSGSVIDWKSRHSRVEVTPRKGFFDDGLAAFLGTWTDSND